MGQGESLFDGPFFHALTHVFVQVSSYLDLTADPKRNQVVLHYVSAFQNFQRFTVFCYQLVSRMKSILLAVKSSPPSEIRNFGA